MTIPTAITTGRQLADHVIALVRAEADVLTANGMDVEELLDVNFAQRFYGRYDTYYGNDLHAVACSVEHVARALEGLLLKIEKAAVRADRDGGTVAMVGTLVDTHSLYISRTLGQLERDHKTVSRLNAAAWDAYTAHISR